MRPLAAPEPRTVPLDRLGALACERLRTVARAAGGRAWLVGGAVRDLLLKRPVGDLDVVVESPADAVAARLPVEVVARSQFGTVVIRWPDGDEWDLVTARSEAYAHPAALPTVAPGDLSQDLARRDFTVNAMAAALADDNWGGLTDRHDGLRDLAAGRLRVLHEQSFVDDPTRMFRLHRYAARLGFSPDKSQRAWFFRAQRVGALARLSGERVRAELERSLSGDDWFVQLRALLNSGLLAMVMPRVVSPDSRCAPLEEAVAAWQGAGWPLPPLLWLVRLELALPVRRDQRDSMAARLAERLSLTEAQRSLLATPLLPPLDPDGPPSRLAAHLDGVTDAQLLLLMCHSPRLAEPVVTYRRYHQALRPTLRGDDLRAMGLEPGPAMGRVLAELRAARIDGHVADDDAERELALALVARERDA